MSRPIKETPVLEGLDSLRFNEAIKGNHLKKVSPEEYERAIKVYMEITIRNKVIADRMKEKK